MHYWNDPLKTSCLNHTWYDSIILWVSCYVTEKKIWEQSLKYYADNELKGIVHVLIIRFLYLNP